MHCECGRQMVVQRGRIECLRCTRIALLHFLAVLLLIVVSFGLAKVLQDHGMIPPPLPNP